MLSYGEIVTVKGLNTLGVVIGHHHEEKFMFIANTRLTPTEENLNIISEFSMDVIYDLNESTCFEDELITSKKFNTPLYNIADEKEEFEALLTKMSNAEIIAEATKLKENFNNMKKYSIMENLMSRRFDNIQKLFTFIMK